MSLEMILALAAGLLLLQIAVWTAILLWIRRKSRAVAARILLRCEASGLVCLLGPQAGLYQGTDPPSRRVRGNGVICLTPAGLIFQKLNGPLMEIPAADITNLSVERSFRGRTARGTGGRFLVLHTKDGRRTGFLTKITSKPPSWPISLRGATRTG